MIFEKSGVEMKSPQDLWNPTCLRLKLHVSQRVPIFVGMSPMQLAERTDRSVKRQSVKVIEICGPM